MKNSALFLVLTIAAFLGFLLTSVSGIPLHVTMPLMLGTAYIGYRVIYPQVRAWITVNHTQD